MGEQHAFLDAAKAFDWVAVKRLIEPEHALVNAQPCGRTGISRWSALHQAAYSGNAKAVFFLIDAGANSLATTGDGKTPIDVAKTGAVRKVLAEYGSISGQRVAPAKGPKNTVPAKLVKMKGKGASMKARKKKII